MSQTISILSTVEQNLSEIKNSFWQTYLKQYFQRSHDITLHLAIFVEPFLEFILDGSKTVESRFSSRRFAPYQKAKAGDILLLKRTSGPVVGLCRVSQVWYYELDPPTFKDIKEKFSEALCATESDFWKKRESARYATLMKVEKPYGITPFPISKRDRRGWVVIPRNGHEKIKIS